jgi:CheY-like chemotaxis protein
MNDELIRSRTVLLVEDEFMIARMMAGTLQQMGCRVLGPVPSGEQAVRTALADRPDLVLMDVRLQGAMDGVDAAQAIRARLDVPIFFLTAQSGASATQRMKAVAGAAVLKKPLATTAFRKTLEHCLPAAAMS